MKLLIICIALLPVFTTAGNPFRQKLKNNKLVPQPPFGPCDENEDCIGSEENLAYCNATINACYCTDGSVLITHIKGDLECAPVLHLIGSTCKDDVQCASGKPGSESFCTPDNSTCQCKDTAVHNLPEENTHPEKPEDHVCHQKANRLEADCAIERQCSHMNATCVANKCKCPSEEYFSNYTTNGCFKKLNKIGEDCEISEQCTQGKPGSYSECIVKVGDFKKTCQCTKGADYDHKNPDEHKCMLAQNRVGGSCEFEEQCLGLSKDGEGLASCENPGASGTCKCTRIAVMKPDETGCYELKKKIGDTCHFLEQCIGDFEDLKKCDGVCKCEDNAEYNHGSDIDWHKCRPKATQVTDPCEFDEQCQANLGKNSSCQDDASSEGDKSCQCNANYNPGTTNPMCLLEATQIGDRCIESSQCEKGTPGSWSYCKTEKDPEGTCQCKEDVAVADSNGKVCLEKVRVENDCTDQNQCCHLGPAECVPKAEGSNTNVCRCIPDKAVPNNDGSLCLDVIENKTVQCQVSEQCTKGKPGLDSSCSQEDISAPFLCTCINEAVYEEFGNTCYKPTTDFGGVCSVDLQCNSTFGEFAECSENDACACTEKAVKGTEKCLPVVEKINGECLEPVQCELQDPGQSKCEAPQDSSNNKMVCLCSMGTVPVIEKNICLPKTPLIGKSCEESEQCEHFGNAQCLPVGGTMQCKCTPGVAVSNTDKDLCLPVVRDKTKPCQVTEQCTEGNPGLDSECKLESGSDICECTGGAEYEKFGNTCYKPVQEYGDSCVVNLQCNSTFGDLALCTSDKTCRCQNSAVEGTQKCLEKVPYINDRCQEAVQCVFAKEGESICAIPEGASDGISRCNCNETFVPIIEKNICLKKADLVGGSCAEHQQCAHLGAAECLPDGENKICTCKEGIAVPDPKNNQCLDVIKDKKDECQVEEQCTEGLPGDESECVPDQVEATKSYCQCKTGAHYEEFGHTCYHPTTTIGDPCTVNLQCNITFGELSECTKTDGCQCKENSVEGTQKCLSEVPKINDPCEEAVQCTFDESQCKVPENASDNIKRCICGDTFVPVIDKNICLPKAVYVGDNCDQVEQCQHFGNAQCLPEGDKKVCKCTEGEAVKNQAGDRCLDVIKDKKVECQVPEQCTVGDPGEHSDCLKDKDSEKFHCQCTNGARYEDFGNTCFKPVADYGENCKVDLQCNMTLGKLSHCTKNDGCRCKTNAVEGASKCLPEVLNINDPCEEAVQCMFVDEGEKKCEIPENSSDDQKVCLCSDISVPDLENNVCLKKAQQVGDACSSTMQCLEVGSQAECLDDTCQCKVGAVENPDHKCQLGIRINDACTNAWECVGPKGSSICSNSRRCQCISSGTPGYVASSARDNCLKIINLIGEECSEPQQCTKGEPGEHSRCTEIEIHQNSEKICNCTAEAITDGEGNECLKKAVKIGDPCKADMQCMVNLEASICSRDNICTCYGSTVPSSNSTKCLPKAGLKENCIDPAQCTTPNSECKLGENKKTCECESTFIQIAGKCLPKAEHLGDVCEADLQCPSTSTCIDKLCQCPPTQVENSNKTVCLPKADSLHGSCIESVQCAEIPNTECVADAANDKKICECKINQFVEVNESCMKIVTELDGDCKSDLQCQAGIGNNTECKDGKTCKCVQPTENYNGKCISRKGLDQKCEIDEECWSGVNEYAACNATKVCECKKPAFEKDKTCWMTLYVGSQCAKDEECSATIIGPVYCNKQTSKCSCPEGYTADKNGYSCRKGNGAIGMQANFVVIFLIGLFHLYY